MYTHPDEVERIATNTAYTKPFYLCEYAHAMFNSMGAIGEYNDLFDKYPTLMGGAIWEWQDQGMWNRRDPEPPVPRLRRRLRRGAQRPLLHPQGRRLLRPLAQAALSRNETAPTSGSALSRRISTARTR